MEISRKNIKEICRLKKTSEKWIKYLLSNENRIRHRLDLFLMTDNESVGENLGVSTSKTGRETENRLVNKLTDKNYIYKTTCLECVKRLYEEMTPMEYEIMVLKFRHGYNSERVGFEVGYSRSSIDSIVKVQKDKLKKMIDEEVCV